MYGIIQFYSLLFLCLGLHKNQSSYPSLMGHPVRYLRALAPAHYKFRIENYSTVAAHTKLSKYESRSFSVGGHRWALVVYPRGNKRGNGHLSLDLTLIDKSNVADGQEILVEAKLFIFDHNKCKYLTVQDLDNVWRYDETKTKWGYDEFIPLKDLRAHDDRYRNNDSVIFGVEILIVKNTGKGESLRISHPPQSRPVTHTWKIHHYSKLDERKVIQDKVYNIAGSEWSLHFFPKGGTMARGENMTLHLHNIDSSTILPNKMVFMEYTFRVKNHKCGNRDFEVKVSSIFSQKMNQDGRRLLSLFHVTDKCLGWLFHDVLTIEFEVTAWSHVSNFG